MGDFIKGNDYQQFDKLIQVGVLLHREIDSFTDHHPTVKQSKNRLKAKYRHYSGVIVDVFYDHFLAQNFVQFCSTPLAEFVQRQYELLERNIQLLPPKAQHMLPYMINGNWLLNYKEEAGVQRSLKGMSRRTKFNSKMDEAIVELYKYHKEFNSEFLEFFPAMQAHAENYRQELVNSHL